MNNLQTEANFTDICEGNALTYAQILSIAVRDNGKEGVTVDGLLERMPVVHLLKEVELDAEIVMTHEQWTMVNDLFGSRRWPVDEGIAEVAVALAAEMAVDLPE